ncbi:MAG TPA: urate hydroxylase PuuD [Acidimicrobiales bacterium]|nr:urate hydroxylase PuuD [Acidimicrobiales bacterium]
MEIFTEAGIEFLARYGHIISGITWIGLLYYFNFVQVPAFAAFEAGSRNEALAKLAPRALWWFRWGAMMTLAFGLLLFILQEQYDADYMKSTPGMAILTGIVMATIMFLNVWLVIWPNQRTVIANAEGLLAGGEADPAAAVAARKAACASRTNTLLSIPMLFFMVATSHFFTLTDFELLPEGGDRAVWWIVVAVVLVVIEGIALRAPAPGKPEAWHIDKHQNTIIGGFVVLAVLYVVMEILFG